MGFFFFYFHRFPRFPNKNLVYLGNQYLWVCAIWLSLTEFKGTVGTILVLYLSAWICHWPWLSRHTQIQYLHLFLIQKKRDSYLIKSWTPLIALVVGWTADPGCDSQHRELEMWWTELSPVHKTDKDKQLQSCDQGQSKQHPSGEFRLALSLWIRAWSHKHLTGKILE